MLAEHTHWPIRSIGEGCSYVELDVGEALADAGLGVADDAHVFDPALLAERPPQALLDVRGDLVALLLHRLAALARRERRLVVDEAEVAHEDAPLVVRRRGVRDAVDPDVALQDLGAVELGGGLAGRGGRGVDGVGVGGLGRGVHELPRNVGGALGHGACGEGDGAEADRLDLLALPERRAQVLQQRLLGRLGVDGLRGHVGQESPTFRPLA